MMRQAAEDGSPHSLPAHSRVHALLQMVEHSVGQKLIGPLMHAGRVEFGLGEDDGQPLILDHPDAIASIARHHGEAHFACRAFGLTQPPQIAIVIILAVHSGVRRHGGAGPVLAQHLLAVVKAAHEEEIPWEKLRYELARHLQKKELQEVRELLDQNHEGYEELPPITYDDEDDPIPSRWWASSVLGSFAEREGSAERKKELQELAGSILGKVKVKKAS